MKKYNPLIIFLFIQLNIVANTLSYNGQLWSIGYHNNQTLDPYDIELGYIPQIFSSYTISNNSIIDFEYAQYIFKNHNNYNDNKIISNKYRSWLRFSNDNSDLRIGLQKITFGTALFLRPLAWFDSLDFRSTTGQTYGVEALRFIFSPSNTLAVWFWIINNDMPSKSFGSRIEISNSVGDWGFTYYQDTDSTQHIPQSLQNIYLSDYILERDPLGYPSPPSGFRENSRLGIDYRYDGNFGFWIEASYYDIKRYEGAYFNDLSFLTLGFDYTIPISNGLLISTETMFSQIDLVNSLETDTYTVLRLSLPINHINHLIFFSLRDWENRGLNLNANNNIVRWSTTYDSFNIDYMVTLNPGRFNDIFQIMFIYNH